MKLLSQLFSHEFNYAITWTIIHSLWQCTLIALLIAISYAFTKKSSASLRYWINCAGLLSCALTSGVTFYLNYYDSVAIEIVSTDYIATMSPNLSPVHFQSISDLINQYINQIAFIWLVGFVLYISKYMAEYFYCQHIKNNRVTEPKQNLLKLFDDLKDALNLHKNIQLRISDIVDIPCVIGHFKPVILLPASLVLGLSAKQLEVILLHELGHVRRNDYLISGLQTLINVFYFFNPFARWISSKIDEERENACDDIAVSQCKDPLFYANTLKEFAEMNNNYSPAVAMTGRQNLLFNRIKRLFISDTSFAKTYGKLLTLMVFFLASIGYSVTGYSEEKKSEADTFSIQIEKEPLSTLLKLTEGYCADIKGKISLKHPDQPISGNFPDLECRSVERMIKGLDDSLNQSLTGIVVDEKNIPLKTLANKIESYCPELKGKITINNPDTLVSFKAENLPCGGIQDAIKHMDTSEGGQSVRVGKIEKIEIKEPSEYEKAFYKELNFPKEIVDKGYTGDCTVTFTVDLKGLGKDIVPTCVSPNDEQKRYFENLISNTAKKAKFPIKMEDGHAVTAKGISIRIKWRNETKATTSNASDTSHIATTQYNQSNSTTNNNEDHQTEDGDFKSGLSINSQANIASYKDIEFAPLFLGKKLIDTTDAKSYRYAQREFGGFDREFISATNNSLLKAINSDKSSVLNPNGTKSLIGEIYIFKIKPYWERELIPYTENGNGANAAITQGTKKFPFRAKVFLGVVLKDAESKEIVAVLKDQFTHEESKTWFNNMSDQQKSRFINEKIIANIRESVNKATSGLIAFSQHRAPLSETQNTIHLISFDAQNIEPRAGNYDAMVVKNSNL
ncbi:M56 family metallopeptidase [Cellvibrio sp.]|uniref:M56 family metallopeptidase n=1 Tax=Cellvibrio sp. TaxID=1965322 RepID=UPI00396475B3